MSRFSFKNILFFCTLYVVLTSALISQQWIVSHDENHMDDRAFGIVTDVAGNIYVTGYVTRPGTGEDIVVIKYNSAKVEQWRRYYNGPGNSSDKAFGIVVDASNNIIVTGYSTGVGSQADFTTIKYNSTGTKLWEQRYNTPVNGDDRAWGIVVDRVGNIYVTGYITLLGTDIYTIKYNSNGVYIWGKVIESPGNGEDKAWGIVADSLGNNIYLCGQTFNDTTGNDFTVARYDSSGTQIWLNKYNGPGLEDDKAFGIVVDRLNNIYVAGYTTGMNSGMDFTTIKYNNAGNILWVNRYNDTLINLNDKAFGIVVDRTGNSYVTGFTTADTSGSTDYFTMKLNPTGETVWRAAYNGIGNFQDTAFAICLPKRSEGVYVTGGSSRIDSAGKLDAVTLKYTLNDGLLVDSSRYNGTDNKNDLGNCIFSDTSGNVYVGGLTETIANSYNILLLKYYRGRLIGIEQLSSKVPENYMLYQNYPNPFNPSTKIKFDVKRPGLVKLVIYDILGKQVNIPLNKYLKTGTYEAELNFQNLSSGIYFYSLSAEGYKQTKKMALIK